jgi:hypothetical protein
MILSDAIGKIFFVHFFDNATSSSYENEALKHNFCSGYDPESGMFSAK